MEHGRLVVFAALARGPDGLPFPGDPPWMIKRAVALPGDPVPPDALPPSSGSTDARVPPGHLVVLGDNHTASFDSRRAGYVDGDTLLGVVGRVLGRTGHRPAIRCGLAMVGQRRAAQRSGTGPTVP